MTIDGIIIIVAKTPKIDEHFGLVKHRSVISQPIILSPETGQTTRKEMKT